VAAHRSLSRSGAAPRSASAATPSGTSPAATPGSGVRFHGQFCYIDAYTEPAPLPGDWPPAGWPETREELLERLRSTPTKLCRLRFFGGEDRWGFAFYTYSNERYELSVFPSGGFLGPPEEAFGVAAGAYLR
jgi:hypothetical protein